MPYQTATVRVIVRDTSTVQKKTLIINKGRNDGLAVGQVVTLGAAADTSMVTSVEALV